jgi:tetratricopeptide (TPR) repeat protein
MVEVSLKSAGFVGREHELAVLHKAIDAAMSGKGSTVMLSGEPGIGKTRLVDEFKSLARQKGVKILAGSAAQDVAQPFLVFSSALIDITDRPIFSEQEYQGFTRVFAVNRNGLFLAQASSDGDEGIDSDIFTGMLAAVQDFVRDSFDQSGGKKVGLGRLEYGDMKILIEHGQHLFLTGVFRGMEHQGMRALLARSMREIETKYGEMLASWTGDIEGVSGIKAMLENLSRQKFLVRKSLEGVKLENEKVRMADEILTLLSRESSSAPLLLVLEDMHWADAPSLFIINYLNRNIKQTNILILCTTRPGESQILEKAISTMRSENQVLEMPLMRLDSSHISSLVDSMCSPNSFPKSFLDRLAGECEGNPFFVTEMLRHMLEDGTVVASGGNFTLVREDYDIPGSIEDMVHRRLESLEPEAFSLAEYASCIGREFSRDAANSMRTLREGKAVFEKLLASGIVTASNGFAGFSHALFQEVIYSGISDKWKSIHHKNLGEYFEATHKGNLDDAIYDLARHFSRSNENHKAFEYCFKAGAKAEAAFAAELAVEYYETCLKVAPRLKPGHDQSGRLADILERQGDLFTFLGDFAKGLEKYDAGMKAFDGKEDRARSLRKIAEIHGKKGDYEKCFSALGEARRLLGGEDNPECGRICMAEAGMRMRRSEYKEAGELLATALSVFEKSGEARFDLSNALRVQGNLHLYKAEFDLARDCYERSIEMCKTSANEAGLSSSLMNLGIVYKEKKEFDKSLAYYEKSFEMLERRKDIFTIGNLLHNMGNVHGDMGENEEALRLFEESLALRKKLGDKFGMESNLAAISGIHYKKGDMAKSLAYLIDAHELSKKLGDVHGQAMTIANLGLVYKSVGDLDKALEYYLASIEIREKIKDRIGMGLSYYNAGNVYLLRGEKEKALENFDKSLQMHMTAGDKDGIIFAQYGIAEARARLGECEDALRLALEGIDKSKQLNMKPLEAMGLKILGIIYREGGEFEKGVEAFESATRLLSEVGDMKQLAELVYEYALLSGKMGDSRKAKAQLENALAEFGRMGMKVWAGRCGTALAELEKK